MLNELSDADLEVVTPSGRTRAHIVSSVGYHARAMSRLVTWAETGDVRPMHGSRRTYLREIVVGATLAPRALRHLSDHAAIELDVAWRDLPDDRWSVELVDLDGEDMDAGDTVRMRTAKLWSASLALDRGALSRDIPADARPSALDWTD
jgi:Mycothiol maleylpyruvate isomerase N-terminal domain.